MRSLSLVIPASLSLLAACSGSSKPAPTPTRPETAPPLADSSSGIELVFAGEGAAAVAAVAHARIEALGITGAAVAPRGEQLVVRLEGAGAERAADVERVLLQRGTFALFAVDAGSKTMRELTEQLARRGDAQILTGTDQWRDPRAEGATRTDPYARAATRKELAKLFAAIEVEGRIARFERVQAPEGEYWRSYWLEAQPIATQDDVEAARLVEGARAEGPQVVEIILEPAAARRFAAITAKSIGEKIAIVVDGEVRSAPVVMARIEGGRLALTMAGSPEDQRRAAIVLVNALEHGVLPKLELVERRRLPTP